MLILSGGDAEDGGERCDVQPVTLIYKSVTPCNTASVVETHTHTDADTQTHTFQSAPCSLIDGSS